MADPTSAYMLIFRETTPKRYAAMSADERRQALDAWNAWCDELPASGTFEHGHPLHDEGRIVSRTGVKPRALDGPFAETKELVGGYVLLSGTDIDQVTAAAERCPSLQYGLTVEIRPIAGGCHLARSLGLNGMRETAPAEPGR